MSQTLPLILFLAPLAYSPGPGNMFFAANGARFGFAATLPASAGYHLATFLVTLAIGLGFATLLGDAPKMLAALRIAGSAYVLMLAYGLFRADALKGGPAPRPAGATSGALLLLLNPKAYVIIALMFTQFLPPAAPHLLVLWIATVFTLNNLIAFSAWTLLGDQLARRFRDPGHARILNRILGVSLGGVALWMLAG